MKVGGPMEVTKEYFDFINIKIDRITEFNALISALESAIEHHETDSEEHITLVSMCNTLNHIR
jgi:pimeloyl-CoA synthetase